MTEKTIIPFTKSQALGNDFIITNNLSVLNTHELQFLADRKLGIGCDQLISLENHPIPNTNFSIHFYNADGSQAGACGNGSRAVAGYYYEQTGKKDFSFAIIKSDGTYDILQAHIPQTGWCSLQMPSPKFEAQDIPLSNLLLDPSRIILEAVPLHYGFCVNVGNPHIVFITDDVSQIDLEKIGYIIEHHPLFPERINTEFIHIIDRDNIRMRVWERGVGITKACGTGACASAITAILQGLCHETVTIHTDGGEMQVTYSPKNNIFTLSGIYQTVFKGEISL